MIYTYFNRSDSLAVSEQIPSKAEWNLVNRLRPIQINK